MYKGKRYSITFDHKPTQKEITIALAEKYQKNEVRKNGTMEYYALKYIDDKRNHGRSPTTITAYQSIIKNTPEWFLSESLFDVDEKELQTIVDEYSLTHSPKSTANFNGFYSSVLSEYRPGTAFNIKLPKCVKKMIYQPSTADIMRIIDAAQNTRYSVFLQLSILGLRRGEIGALTLDDLSEQNILTISKDLIKNENNQYVIKETPKTNASNRRILIPSALADEIRAQGYIYKGNINNVNKYLHRVQEQLNIPQFNLHILRHFSAAYLNKLGFTRDQILDFCGWEKGSNVMEKVYSYNLDPEETQKNIADAFDSLIR
jgi:integrase